MNEFAIRSVRTTLYTAIAVCVAAMCYRQWWWAAGFMLAALWTTVNFLVTMNLLKTAILQRSKQKLFVSLAIKFPILYLALFLLLTWKRLPVSSVLAGIPLIILVMGVVRVWPKRT
jgi:hypothetical protein